MNRESVRDEILNMNNPNILLEIATGVGKSKYALDVMNKLYPNTNRIKHGILIVIYRNVLADGWLKEIAKWGYTQYLPYVEIVNYKSLHKKAGSWDFVIFDECHHLSERCIEVLESFNIAHSILLSATVKRDHKRVLQSVFNNLGIYRIPAKEAIEGGILPDPRVYLVPMLLDNKTTDCVIVKNKGKGNPITISFKERMRWIGVKNRQINIRCTQQQYYNDMSNLADWYYRRMMGGVRREFYKHMYLKICGDRLKWLSDLKTSFIHSLLVQLKDERTLTFCNSIAQTEALGTYCVNSKNTDSEKNLQDFNDGRVNHITACNMLDEGVNLTNCRVGIYATLNSSERMIAQKLGRLLRHEEPIIIIPYYKYTRDEEIVKKMCENYNMDLVTTINDLSELQL